MRIETMKVGCYISLVSTTHKFEKQNLVTLIDRYGFAFDRYQCKYCGLTGRRRGFSAFLEMKEGGLSEFCPKAPPDVSDKYTSKQVIIVSKPFVNNPAFNNILVGSHHRIIEPPKDEIPRNGLIGVWVMGVGEPVRLLPGEFEMIDVMEQEPQRTRKKEEVEMKRTRP